MVRHWRDAVGRCPPSGFIPWDDDIDVGMPRPDYERFEALCRRSSDPRFVWQSRATNPAYPFIYGKLLLAGTEVIEPAVAHLPIQHSVYIDVFPIDGAPGSSVRPGGPRPGAEAGRDGRRSAHPALGGAALRRAHVPGNACRVGDQPGRRPDPHVYLRQVSTRGHASGAWGYAPECQPRSRFMPPATLDFEGMPVPAPGRWREYLTQVYGDYMQLPPLERRHARHGFVIVNLGDDPDDSPATQ